MFLQCKQLCHCLHRARILGTAARCLRTVEAA